METGLSSRRARKRGERLPVQQALRIYCLKDRCYATHEREHDGDLPLALDYNSA